MCAALLGASGPPIGILSGAAWTDERAVVAPGETMVFYTDGIVEARAGVTVGPRGGDVAEYGMDNLCDVAKANAGAGPKGLLLQTA